MKRCKRASHEIHDNVLGRVDLRGHPVFRLPWSRTSAGNYGGHQRTAGNHSREQSIGFDHTFTSTGLDSTDYYNESSIQIDSSVQSMSISFRKPQMPLSETFESLIGNETNLIRYVDAKLWSPGSKSAGSEPYWEIRVTQDHSLERWDYTGMNFKREFGFWRLMLEATVGNLVSSS